MQLSQNKYVNIIRRIVPNTPFSKFKYSFTLNLFMIHLGAAKELTLLVNMIIFSIIILAICTGVNLVLLKLKPAIKQNTNFYLYAFSTGLLIIIGTIGLLKEGIDHAKQFYASSSNLVPMIIVISGAVAGLIFTLSSRFLLSKKFKHIHIQHEMHNHSDHIINTFDIDNPKAAWFVICLLLIHRTIDGFTLGALVPKLLDPVMSKTINYGFFIAFFLHIIFEIIFIYYRQIQYGQKKWKALLYNFYTILAFIVIFFIGGFLYEPINKTKWIIPFANGFGGIIITFVSIIEIVPEFIHFRNIDARRWYITIGWFSLGLIVALALISIENF